MLTDQLGFHALQDSSDTLFLVPNQKYFSEIHELSLKQVKRNFFQKGKNPSSSTPVVATFPQK